MSTTLALTQEIDALLEQYLHLLNTYTTLRTQLSTAQSSIQQSLARANFTADRGVRYGSDCYDSRMRATRFVSISEESEFSISLEEAGKEDVPSVHVGDGAGNEDPPTANTITKRRDPIRMFGILIPQALRSAQGEAIKMVEEIVPKLVGISKEMEGVEIEVRRRRKWLRKAEEVEREKEMGEGMNMNGMEVEGTRVLVGN